MRLKKSLSQVFLTNRSYLEKISRAVDINGQIVVEGGPGSGRMTEYFLNAKKLYCVELDERMCILLKEKFSHAANIEIIQADILNFDFSAFKEKVVFYSNIPYSISKKIVERLIGQRRNISRAYILCQREFAAKIIAKTGDEAYGFLSCFTQYYAKPKKLLDVPRAVFSPKPNVDSTLVELDFEPAKTLLPGNEKRFFEILHRAFSYPRKQIGAILAGIIPADALNAAGIDFKSRPAQISLGQYLYLANRTP